MLGNSAVGEPERLTSDQHRNRSQLREAKKKKKKQTKKQINKKSTKKKNNNKTDQPIT